MSHGGSRHRLVPISQFNLAEPFDAIERTFRLLLNPGGKHSNNNSEERVQCHQSSVDDVNL